MAGAHLPLMCEWEEQAGEELAVTPPVEALNDAAGEVEELNGFFRRYALAA